MRRSVAFDVFLAVVLTVLLQLDVWTGTGEGEVYELKPLSSALMLLVTVPFAWRRRGAWWWPPPTVSLERPRPSPRAHGWRARPSPCDVRGALLSRRLRLVGRG